MAKRNDRWIQEAIKRPGRVHRYLARVYGKKAFDKRGRIKYKYLDMAIKRVKNMPKSRRPKGLLQALYLAKMLKKKF